MSLIRWVDDARAFMAPLAREPLSKAWVEKCMDDLAGNRGAGAFDLVVDLRSVSAVRVTSDEVRALASRCGGEAVARRVAIVAESDVIFGLARMFAMLSEQVLPGVVVFRRMDLALEHLAEV